MIDPAQSDMLVAMFGDALAGARRDSTPINGMAERPAAKRPSRTKSGVAAQDSFPESRAINAAPPPSPPRSGKGGISYDGGSADIVDHNDGVGTVDSVSLLHEWSARYPELQAEFAAVAMDWLSDEPIAPAAEIERQVEITRSLLKKMSASPPLAPPVLGRIDQKPGEERSERGWVQPRLQLRSDEGPFSSAVGPRAVPSAVSGLADAAAACGIDFPGELAARVRLPVVVLERLARRMVEPSTIPAVLVQQLGEYLQAGRAEVLAWISVTAAPTGFQGVAYVREKRSRYSVATSFAEALTQASDIDPADRVYWDAVARFSGSVGSSVDD